jgi:hypothetical protein
VPLESPWDCVNCPAVVKIGSPYREGPCGTFCSECIKLHVKCCAKCAQRFPEAVTPRFVCPNCRSESLSENNMVQVRVPVIAWDATGRPLDFRPRWREVEDTIRCVRANEALRYHCEDCNEEFDAPESINQLPPVNTPL